MTLPDISLTLHTEKKTSLQNTSSNTNTNTINNNIILEPKAVNITDTVADTTADQNPSGAKINKSVSMDSLAIKSPDNIRRFKDQFTAFLIEYFKNDMILLNNLLEVSDKIVFKIDDLKILIGILLEIDVSKIDIEYEDMIKSAGCCGSICKRIPLFKKITDIYINNKQSFSVGYNSIAIQLQNSFNVSLNYIIV
jgi:hypothetical protein